jgi:outer membrane protein assembly factor BamB
MVWRALHDPRWQANQAGAAREVAELGHSSGGNRFVLGTEWLLRALDAKGQPLWQRAVPGTVWAVNITGDGRLVVAACGDGTIHWHRIDDGRELRAL